MNPGRLLVWLASRRANPSRAGSGTALAPERALAQAQGLERRQAEFIALHAAQSLRDQRQAVLEERQRIMRDMHDGLGAQLLAAVRMAADPAVSRALLARQLQDALDHLKLSVDAMQDADGDIAMLLGALRYRMAPRLAALGLSLGWEVQVLPVIPAWNIGKSRHLQLLLFEAIANILAHAGATRIELSATVRPAPAAHVAGRPDAPRQICITLSDDGRGFAMVACRASHGQGMANMRHRAGEIGAGLTVESSSSGALLRLVIDLGPAAA